MVRAAALLVAPGLVKAQMPPAMKQLKRAAAAICLRLWRAAHGTSPKGVGGAQPRGGRLAGRALGTFWGTEPREADFFFLITNILSFEFRCVGCWSFVQFNLFLFQQMEDRSPSAFVCLRIK
jgi:hypothetical protein